MRRPWSAVVLVLLLAVAAFVGVWAVAGRGRLVGGPAGGSTLVVLATRAAGSTAIHGELEALSLHARGGSWVATGLGTTPVDLAQTVAPEQTNILSLPAPVGVYDQVRVTFAGRLTVLPVRLSLAGGRVSPLLLVASAGPVIRSAYGPDDVNAGLQEVAGQIPRAPDFVLSDQTGRSTSLTDFAGRVLLLAAFDTRCTESCPLMTATLLQVESQLRARGLGGSVAIAEVTQDPGHDTPAVLADYARATGADWPLLTGDPAEVMRLLGALHLEVDRASDRVIDHTEALEVIDAHGYLRRQLSGNPRLQAIPPEVAAALSPAGRQRALDGAWTVSDVLADVDGLLGRSTSEVSAESGLAAHGFSAPSLAGGPGGVRLAASPGAPVLVDFWASYCAPCRAELPMLVATAGRHSSSGLVLLGVDELEGPEAGRGFLQRLGLDLQSGSDPDHRVGDLYGVYALPTAVFIGADGRVAATVVGEIDQATLDARLAEIGA